MPVCGAGQAGNWWEQMTTMSGPSSTTSLAGGKLLIEEWLPLQELGIEARRENSTGQHPPPNRLHVWWARRPLVVSRAAVLASLLPAWRPDWPEALRQRFPTREAYHAWVRRLLGILGDPVAARRRIAEADAQGERLGKEAYGYSRAFTFSPSEEEVALLRRILAEMWADNEVATVDPMSGGGSIPLEALRLGLTVYANELNPVAAVILTATLDFPARFGESLADDIRQWGDRLVARVRPQLQPFFPDPEGGALDGYLWARTVACPQTGKPIPLSPNWWLRRDEKERVAVRLLVHPDWPTCQFTIVYGAEAEAVGDQGTIRRGVAVSPWTGEVVDGDYIKREAQAGRMGQQLYAVVVKTPRGIAFRLPSEADLAAVAAAEEELARRLPGWLARGLVPDEEIPPDSNYNRGHRLYGMTRWRDLFAPRQLLALGTAVEALRELEPAIQAALPPDRARAVVTYLALAIDKLADYNSRMSLLDVTRVLVKHTFDRHDFSMKWSHAEMAVVAAGKGLDWAIDQVIDAYRGIARLTQSARLPLWQRAGSSPVERLRVTQGDARRLAHLPDGSVHLVCIDPPYYDNVQYAELSDFFYVWLKRTVGHHYPDWFAAPLVSKEDEAVANPARFAGIGKRARELARQDYERKMTAVFRECARVLRPDGVLTVMFTHKQVEAWDALAAALIEAGFQIVASWPVHTESEHSLHQVRKNAARSTILLVCRKRPPGDGPVWWDDLRGELARRVRVRAQELAAQGIGGVDLFLAAYGPALSVISARWPVLTSATDPTTGKPVALRPETALDVARREVLWLRRERLLHGQHARFDPETDWYLLAWDTFRAVEFPADEARKLALAVGLDLSDVIERARLVQRKGDMVALLTPSERRRRRAVDPAANSFARLIDAVHAALLVYDEDGPVACGNFLRRTGYWQQAEFRQCLQALLEAIPRRRKSDGSFLRPEAESLERLRLAFFPELEPPTEPVAEAAVLQLGLLDSEGAEASQEDEE